MRIQNRCAKKNCIQNPPHLKMSVKTSYNTAQGAPHGFPPALRGFAHMVFWMGPAVQTPFRVCATKRRLLSRGFHSTLRAFAPGGVSPHCANVLAFRPSSKKPRHPRQRYMQFGLAQLVPVNWAKFFYKMGIQEITKRAAGKKKSKETHSIPC